MTRYLPAAVLAALAVGAGGIVLAQLGASQAELGPEEAELAYSRWLAVGRYALVIVVFVALGRHVGRAGGTMRQGALLGALAGFAGALATAGAIAWSAGDLLGALVRQSADPEATALGIAMGFFFTQLLGAAEGALLTMLGAHLFAGPTGPPRG